LGRVRGFGNTTAGGVKVQFGDGAVEGASLGLMGRGRRGSRKQHYCWSETVDDTKEEGFLYGRDVEVTPGWRERIDFLKELSKG